jgi:O-antigen/teichoic acid export membrane protein
MLEGCLLIGFAVIAVAIWLEYNDSLGWPNELERERANASERDDRYRIIRRRWRRVVHALIAICGALMASAGIAGPGRYWIAAWTAVAMLMFVIIVLALGDAFRTHRHFSSKRPTHQPLPKKNP